MALNEHFVGCPFAALTHKMFVINQSSFQNVVSLGSRSQWPLIRSLIDIVRASFMTGLLLFTSHGIGLVNLMFIVTSQ